MHQRLRSNLIFTAGLFLPAAHAVQPGLVLRNGQLASCGTEVLRSMSHTSRPFTQGLELTPGRQLLETSGDYPPGVGSFIRLVDPQSGQEIRRTSEGLSGGPGTTPYFLEGITRLNGHWFATTYTDKLMLEYDEDLKYVTSHPFPYEGWGLTHAADGRSFLVTNSTEYLIRLDPTSMQPSDVKAITCLGKRVPGMNELEMVPDFMGRGPAVLGNLINTRLILAIDPETARCLAVINVGGVGLERETSNEHFGYHVANGVAHDSNTGTFFITGKNWDSLFEVRFNHQDAPETLLMLQEHLAEASPA